MLIGYDRSNGSDCAAVAVGKINVDGTISVSDIYYGEEAELYVNNRGCR